MRSIARNGGERNGSGDMVDCPSGPIMAVNGE